MSRVSQVRSRLPSNDTLKPSGAKHKEASWLEA
jgi:hypothetical protein